MNQQKAWIMAALAAGLACLFGCASAVTRREWEAFAAWLAAGYFAFCEAVSCWRILDRDEALQQMAKELSRPTVQGDPFSQLGADIPLWAAGQVADFAEEVEPLRQATLDQARQNEDDGLDPTVAQRMAAVFYEGGLNRLRGGGDTHV